MHARKQPLNLLRFAAVSLVALASAACSDNKQYETASCALIDVSGTYAREKAEVVKLVKVGILPKLKAGDSLFVITIDSNSYEQNNLIASINLDYVPSQANDQKLAFASHLDRFAASDVRSSHTDISGAMMLCSDYLKSTGAGKRAVFLFSDMLEELQKGLKRNFKKDEFAGVHFAALNVIKLDKDAANPEVYRNRLASWEKRLTKAGARSWAVIVDPVKIPEYIEKLS